MDTIRRATRRDIASVLSIYNESVMQSVASFDLAPKTIEEQTIWFEKHDDRHPILVYEEGGEISGWASLNKWSERAAYDDTVEISLYVAKSRQGKGVGKRLLAAILQLGGALNFHTIIAQIAEGNEASVRLFESFGFTRSGVLKEVGYKFGRTLDVYLLQKFYPVKISE